MAWVTSAAWIALWYGFWWYPSSTRPIKGDSRLEQRSYTLTVHTYELCEHRKKRPKLQTTGAHNSQEWNLATSVSGCSKCACGLALQVDKLTNNALPTIDNSNRLYYRQSLKRKASDRRACFFSQYLVSIIYNYNSLANFMSFIMSRSKKSMRLCSWKSFRIIWNRGRPSDVSFRLNTSNDQSQALLS